MGAIPINIAEHVGNTPMVRLTRLVPADLDVELYGKLEAFNPGGSVKDRIGVGMIEAVDAARAMAEDPDVYLPDQFSNPANPEAHRTGTGPEILRALDGRVDVFVAGVGTGGTITGVGQALKAQNPRALVVAVEPAASAVLNGGRPGPHRIQGIGAGFVPAVLNRDVVDEVLPCPDDDAIEYAHLLAA